MYVHTHTKEYQPLKEEKPPIFDNMAGPSEHDAKLNKSEKEKYYIISLLCGIKKKRAKPKS